MVAVRLEFPFLFLEESGRLRQVPEEERQLGGALLRVQLGDL